MQIPNLLSIALAIAQVQATCYACHCVKSKNGLEVVDKSRTRVLCGLKHGSYISTYKTCHVNFNSAVGVAGWKRGCTWDGICDETSDSDCN
ncbi:hypothetical protein LZ30DRAFT_742215 [Colletotrichum cereale]|nr:hypothetical protein LZ30DRAFT_742215 [Colletotrichum cereale]